MAGKKSNLDNSTNHKRCPQCGYRLFYSVGMPAHVYDAITLIAKKLGLTRRGALEVLINRSLRNHDINRTTNRGDE